MHTARYHITASDPAAARALATSLGVEAADPLPRARVRVTMPAADAVGFEILVEADDLATLRAASNSFLKWLQAADASMTALTSG